MRFFYNIFKKYIQRKTSIISFMSYENQKEIINRFKNPENLIERSYFQFKCQTLSRKIIVQNIIAIVLIPYYLLKKHKKPEIIKYVDKHNSCVFLTEGISTDIIPDSLKQEFDQIYENYLIDNVYLNREDKKFILEHLKKYYHKPYFSLKCTIKIGIYSKVIEQYNPKAIITNNEYSFTSSLLTEYCRFKKVEHINVMHGEKFFSLTDAFIEFDRFYVWDQHYVDLFMDLRAKKDQFIIEKPRSLRIKCIKQDRYIYEIKYFLGAECIKDLKEIRENLIKTKISFDKICIRYHPRFGDIKKIKQIFQDFYVEDPFEVSLNKSLSNTRYVASLYSTVLYQAFESGKEVVIDDVSNKEKYETLRDLKYIMISKPHILLSDLINRNEDEVTIS